WVPVLGTSDDRGVAVVVPGRLRPTGVRGTRCGFPAGGSVGGADRPGCQGRGGWLGVSFLGVPGPDPQRSLGSWAGGGHQRYAAFPTRGRHAATASGRRPGGWHGPRADCRHGGVGTDGRWRRAAVARPAAA